MVITLCDYCMCICLYVCRAGPDLYTKRGPMPGGAHNVFIIYGMWCFGELSKLCAYSFSLCFKYFQFQREELGMIAEHTRPRSVFS